MVNVLGQGNRGGECPARSQSDSLSSLFVTSLLPPLSFPLSVRHRGPGAREAGPPPAAADPHPASRARAAGPRTHQPQPRLPGEVPSLTNERGPSSASCCCCCCCCCCSDECTPFSPSPPSRRRRRRRRWPWRRPTTRRPAVSSPGQLTELVSTYWARLPPQARLG